MLLKILGIEGLIKKRKKISYNEYRTYSLYVGI